VLCSHDWSRRYVSFYYPLLLLLLLLFNRRLSPRFRSTVSAVLVALHIIHDLGLVVITLAYIGTYTLRRPPRFRLSWRHLRTWYVRQPPL